MSNIKDYRNLKNVGNYTKGAVQSFENNIVLEKVDKNLEDKK